MNKQFKKDELQTVKEGEKKPDLNNQGNAN